LDETRPTESRVNGYYISIPLVSCCNFSRQDFLFDCCNRPIPGRVIEEMLKIQTESLEHGDLLKLLDHVEGAGLLREVLFGLFVMRIGQKICEATGGAESEPRPGASSEDVGDQGEHSAVQEWLFSDIFRSA